MQKKSHYGVPLERSDYLALEAHRHSCPPERFARWLEGFGRDRRLAIDLFSGAGGLSLGLQRAGWTLAAAVDHDERALETHRANFPGMSLNMDLGDPAERDRLEEILEPARGKIDLVAGGPPCQPFSRAGRSKIRSLIEEHGRDPHDRRKELWKAYLDVIERLQPRAVLMENVPDMGLSDDFVVLRVIEQRLEALGYAAELRLVDAWRYGVPQHRKRLILLARRDVECFDWPDALPEDQITTLRDAISDLPPLHAVATERVGARELRYSTPPEMQSDFAADMRKRTQKEKVWDHMTRRVRKDDWKIFNDMTSSSLYSDVDASLRRYKADQFTDKYKKLDWDDLSRTITAHIAKDGYWYIHPDQNRTLTVREAARIQTFPDRFRFAGTRSDAFRQIGNAVPPLLGRAAATALLPVKDQPANSGVQSRWSTVRKELTSWATNQRDNDSWHQLPKLSPLHAAVVAILSRTRIPSDRLGKLLESIRHESVLTDDVFKQLLADSPTASAAERTRRLSGLVDVPDAWAVGRSGELPSLLDLKPAETRLYHLLIGDDVLWTGQSALRVAARLNGSFSDRTNRMSDGRVDLVRLVGAGEDASLRMAALRLIGNTVCKVREPLCTACPLARFCEGRAGVAGEDLFTSAQDS
ncbi:DNA cytosine methyltransferase [Actinomadura gamaensis]|uniref:Cytosine-specific methyltransferase n=1 Tax=Actinomadura gamaensis TaxID=1763541 RepID=A0ABV9U7B4_9ACTN